MKKILCFLVVISSVFFLFNERGLAEENAMMDSASSLKFRILTEKLVYGSFVNQDGRLLHFEAIRGEANDLSLDADAPPFALDIRILNRELQPFMVRTGGARPIDPWWYEDQKEAERKENRSAGHSERQEDERLADFRALTDLATALREFQINSQRDSWILSELIAFSDSIRESDLFDEDLFRQALSERGSQKAAEAKKYKHKGYIRWKKASNTAGLLEHSAFLLRIYTSGGTLKFNLPTCNHGTCSDKDSMTTSCTKEWERSNASIYMWDFMCDGLTPYGAHVCHDDTELQYYSTKNQNFDSNKAWSICSSPSKKMPSCN